MDIVIVIEQSWLVVEHIKICQYALNQKKFPYTKFHVLEIILNNKFIIEECSLTNVLPNISNQKTVCCGVKYQMDFVNVLSDTVNTHSVTIEVV